MRPGLRKSLYVKDDDWRLSLMMGNFVTLTNVDDQELDRIIRRHVSPLFISVHATDGQVRKRMMRNPNAENILPRLKRLKENGIRFHCQIVCCPGWNDGEVLRQTLDDLAALAPAAQTVAVVPVGLTAYRDGLERSRCLTGRRRENCWTSWNPFGSVFFGKWARGLFFHRTSFIA